MACHNLCPSRHLNARRMPQVLTRSLVMALMVGWAGVCSLTALERPETEFKIYQFPSDAIPRIDGSFEDWESVPDLYGVGTEQLWDSLGKHETIQPESLDVTVKVAWVKGMSRLYFYYEAYDDYWDFSLPGLKNDTFEIVVDGDLSGEPFVSRFRENADEVSEQDYFQRRQGEHAQNYHIFTPAREKSWAMLWGPQQWLKELPYANIAYDYDFEPGEGGVLRMEFFVTLFDHASKDGPTHSELTQLVEGNLIGLSWAIIDYDDVESPRNNGFWNLSRAHTMYGKAAELVGFRLMPLEQQSEGIRAYWTHQVVDVERRLVAFRDESAGSVDHWHWDFGDGASSTEQHPVHTYEEAGHYVVVLTVKGPAGQSRYSRVWDVSLP